MESGDREFYKWSHVRVLENSVDESKPEHSKAAIQDEAVY